MKRWFYLCLIVCFAILPGCKKTVEKISDKKPLAFEVSRVRSYYHAQNIKNRLQDKGLEPYVVAINDSVEGGNWYSILVGAEKDTIELKNFNQVLSSTYRLDSLKVVDYQSIKNDMGEILVEEIKEVEKIDSDKPDVPHEIWDVISKFPKSNMFYVQKMYVFNAPEKNEEIKQYSAIKNVKMDLPRGINTNQLLKFTSAFAEAIYKDNIYGDRVTLDILKLKSNHEIAKKTIDAGFLNFFENREYQLEIAEFFADLILNTGEYDTEEKTEIEIVSFSNLIGYKTVIEPKKDYFRTYLILVDESGDYVIFCQSTDKSQEDLYSILQLVGKSGGMIEYDEFYNTFFTLPSKLTEDDIFLGFYIDKLDWSYAKSKGYAKWAKEYVGHWSAHGLFYNLNKGPWSYGIFDLLTEEKVVETEKLYASDESKNKEPIQVYGTDGFFITRVRINFDTWEAYRHPREVNFPFSRYVCMVDNFGDTRLNKGELILRAHAFQFKRGGYQEESSEEQVVVK